jgi:hypothetical protein
MTRQFILMTNSPLIYWILDATAERDTQILMQFIYRNQAIILTIDPAIWLQVLSHNLNRPTLRLRRAAVCARLPSFYTKDHRSKFRQFSPR